MNKNRGITLIALVVTIIILLILAGITISTLSGENGLFARAKQARQNTLDAQSAENQALLGYEDTINSIVDGAREDVTISKEEYEEMKQSIIDMQQELANVKTELTETKTNLSSTTAKAQTSESEINTIKQTYATKEYADAVPQNSGKYSDSNWTLLATKASTTGESYVKQNINIDEYNYIALAISDGVDGCILGPVIMSVTEFKKSCTSSSKPLMCQSNSINCTAYYNSGVYLNVAVKTGSYGKIYGLK